MKLKELETILNTLYQPEKYQDAIPSGLLVEGTSVVNKGITAVSFSKRLVEEAVDLHVDFIIVHHAHGFWNNQPKLFHGEFRDMLHKLFCNNINLFGYHIPMDMQPEIGTNVAFLKAIGFGQDEILPPINDKILIFRTSEFWDFTFRKIYDRIESIGCKINFSFPFGNDKIKTIGICTGAGATLIREAKNMGVDLFITGEAKEDTYVFCQNEKFNFIAAGHHNTEKFGPMLLADLLTVKGIPTDFVDIPNPV
jgi:dinuclear metal center YbgI/SA1388 family protein